MPANQLFADWVTGDIITATKLNQMKNDLAALSGAAFTGGISGTTASFSGLMTAGGGLTVSAGDLIVSSGSATFPTGKSNLFDVLVQDSTDVTATITSLSQYSLGTISIPTTVAAGDVLFFVYTGDLENSSGASVDFTWTIKLGATTLLTSPATTVGNSASGTRRGWRLSVMMELLAVYSQQTTAVFSYSTAGASNQLASGGTLIGTGGSGINLATATNLDFIVQANSGASLIQQKTFHRLLYVGR